MSQGVGIIVVGVGGQGVVSLARILGNAAIDAGLDARIGQIHGLSQRGGSVRATIRIGQGGTAFVSPGEANVVVALEPLEAEREVSAMSPDATVLVNQTPIVPTGLTLNRAAYPEVSLIVSRIDEVAGNVYLIDGTERAQRAGNVRLLNVVMVGAIAGLELLPVSAGSLAAAAERLQASTDPTARRTAFSLGEELGKELMISPVAAGVPSHSDGAEITEKGGG